MAKRCVHRSEAGDTHRSVAPTMPSGHQAIQISDQAAFTLQQVADLLVISKRSVERAIDAGALSSVKMTGGRRVTRAQFDSYVLSLEIESGFVRPRKPRERG